MLLTSDLPKPGLVHVSDVNYTQWRVLRHHVTGEIELTLFTKTVCQRPKLRVLFNGVGATQFCIHLLRCNGIYSVSAEHVMDMALALDQSFDTITPTTYEMVMSIRLSHDALDTLATDNMSGPDFTHVWGSTTFELRWTRFSLRFDLTTAVQIAIEMASLIEAVDQMTHRYAKNVLKTLQSSVDSTAR